MKKKPGRGESIVSGIVTPSAWDENYNVISVKISASGEKEYLIDTQGKGKELFGCVREHIKVLGKLRHDLEGKRIITVEEFEKVQP